jgi:hypothetical protein
VSAATKLMLAPAGSTGNITGPAVDGTASSGAIAFQFVVEAAGATPTVTYKYQGSLDGVNWYDEFYGTDSTNVSATTTRTMTAVGAQVAFHDTDGGDSRAYAKFRVVVTANTNVTFRAEMYVFAETDI